MRAVQSIASQGIWPMEIIIVDQSSHPSTETDFQKLFTKKKQSVKIKVLPCPNISGLTAARNLAFLHASGEIIQYMDDDSALEQKYFEKLLPFFLQTKIHAACGRIIEPKQRFHPLAKYFQKVFYRGPFQQIREEWYHHKNPKDLYTNTLPGVSAFRREVLQKYKFDENLSGGCLGEDVEFSFRSKKEFLFLLATRPKIRHLPHQKNRSNKLNQAMEKSRFYKYHFNKNIQKTLKNKIAYIWLNISFFLHAIADLSPKRFVGSVKGLYKKIPQ